MAGGVKHNTNEQRLLARLIRAEAEGDGELGMLLVGNTGVNRVLGDCLDFKKITSVQKMVFQKPGGFEATQKSYFYQKARDKDMRLAARVLSGKRFVPATFSLWFFNPGKGKPCPAQWYGQWNSGRFKSHCFFSPLESACPTVF